MTFEPKLSEDVCTDIGGHCYHTNDYDPTSIPPQYDRTCKHCGKKQRGVEQPSVRWEDLD